MVIRYRSYDCILSLPSLDKPVILSTSKLKGSGIFPSVGRKILILSSTARATSYRKDDNGIAVQRIRTQVHFIASESLQGVVHFEIGNIHWGRGSAGGALGTDGVNIETKHAYLDWVAPSSRIPTAYGVAKSCPSHGHPPWQPCFS